MVEAQHLQGHDVENETHERVRDEIREAHVDGAQLGGGGELVELDSPSVPGGGVGSGGEHLE